MLHPERSFEAAIRDAEGMDLEVLSGLDFSRFRPAVICTEVYEANPGKDHRKAGLLERNGYRLRGRVGSDTIWSGTDVELELESGQYSGKDLAREIAGLPVSGAGVVAFDSAIQAGGVVTISGWAFAPDQTVPGLILVGVKTGNGFDWRQSARYARSDVARHFANPGVLFSGFRASFPLRIESPALVTVVQAQGNSRWDNTASVTMSVA